MKNWRIVRQDDNGVQYVIVDKFSSRTAAENWLETIEAYQYKPHKQTFWVEEVAEDKPK